MIHHRLLHSAANEFAKSKKIQQKQASLLPDSREHPIVSKVRGTEPSMGRGRNPLSTSNRSRRNQSREVKERKRREREKWHSSDTSTLVARGMSQAKVPQHPVTVTRQLPHRSANDKTKFETVVFERGDHSKDLTRRRRKSPEPTRLWVASNSHVVHTIQDKTQTEESFDDCAGQVFSHDMIILKMTKFFLYRLLCYLWSVEHLEAVRRRLFRIQQRIRQLREARDDRQNSDLTNGMHDNFEKANINADTIGARRNSTVEGQGYGIDSESRSRESSATQPHEPEAEDGKHKAEMDENNGISRREDLSKTTLRTTPESYSISNTAIPQPNSPFI